LKGNGLRLFQVTIPAVAGEAEENRKATVRIAGKV
jgi:hypothetical protein